MCMYGITYIVKCIIMRWRRTQILTLIIIQELHVLGLLKTRSASAFQRTNMNIAKIYINVFLEFGND